MLRELSEPESECSCLKYPYTASQFCEAEGHAAYARYLAEVSDQSRTSLHHARQEAEDAHRQLNALGVQRTLGPLSKRIAALADERDIAVMSLAALTPHNPNEGDA